MNLKIPFSKSVSNWVVEAGLAPDEIAKILLIAELTDSEPDSVYKRVNALEAECKRILYDLG